MMYTINTKTTQSLSLTTLCNHKNTQIFILLKYGPM